MAVRPLAVDVSFTAWLQGWVYRWFLLAGKTKLLFNWKNIEVQFNSVVSVAGRPWRTLFRCWGTRATLRSSTSCASWRNGPKRTGFRSCEFWALLWSNMSVTSCCSCSWFQSSVWRLRYCGVSQKSCSLNAAFPWNQSTSACNLRLKPFWVLIRALRWNFRKVRPLLSLKNCLWYMQYSQTSMYLLFLRNCCCCNRLSHRSLIYSRKRSFAILSQDREKEVLAGPHSGKLRSDDWNWHKYNQRFLQGKWTLSETVQVLPFFCIPFCILQTVGSPIKEVLQRKKRFCLINLGRAKLIKSCTSFTESDFQIYVRIPLRKRRQNLVNSNFWSICSLLLPSLNFELGTMMTKSTEL